MNLHINLPPTFFGHPTLQCHFERAAQRARVTTSSADTMEDLLTHLLNSDGVLMWAWPTFHPELMGSLSQLRFAGFLDVGRTTAKTLLNNGVAVSLTRRAWSPAVAELALTLLLSALRKTPQHHAAMWAGTETWVEHFPGDIDPQERQLSGLTVGIIGLGGIGAGLARLLAPFQCEILAYDPFLKDEDATRVGAELVSLDDLAARSEAVVLCAATTPESEGLFNASHINALRSDAIFVNVSRPQNMDGVALLNRLQKGELVAALDVFEQEPLPLDSPLRRLPNVLLTPHRGGGIFGSIHRHFECLISDWEAHIEGRPRQYGVDERILPLLGN